MVTAQAMEAMGKRQMVTWATKLLFSLFNYFSIPAPACQPIGNDCAVSETDDQISRKFLSSSAFGSLSSDYRRANDDKDAEGDKGEVDEEDDVEEGEVAQRGHVLAVGAHQVGPRTGGQIVFFLPEGLTCLGA